MASHKTVLVTGGAGFIGSHLVDALIGRGYHVRVLDNLAPPTHNGKLPDWFNPKAKFIRGDVRRKKDLAAALRGVDYVFHLAGSNRPKDPAEFKEINLELTQSLIDFARIDIERYDTTEKLRAAMIERHIDIEDGAGWGKLVDLALKAKVEPAPVKVWAEAGAGARSASPVRMARARRTMAVRLRPGRRRARALRRSAAGCRSRQRARCARPSGARRRCAR